MENELQYKIKLKWSNTKIIMKRFTIKLFKGKCIMFDFHFKFPIDIHFGYYGKRAVSEMHKLTKELN